MPRNGGYLETLSAVQDSSPERKLTNKEKESMWQILGIRMHGGGRKRRSRTKHTKRSNRKQRTILTQNKIRTRRQRNSVRQIARRSLF